MKPGEVIPLPSSGPVPEFVQPDYREAVRGFLEEYDASEIGKRLGPFGVPGMAKLRVLAEAVAIRVPDSMLTPPPLPTEPATETAPGF